MIRSLNPSVFPAGAFLKCDRQGSICQADRHFGEAPKGKQEPRPVKTGRGFFVHSAIPSLFLLLADLSGRTMPASLLAEVRTMPDQPNPAQVPESPDEADQFATRLPGSQSSEPETVPPSGPKDAA